MTIIAASTAKLSSEMEAISVTFVVRAFNAAVLTSFLWDILLNLGQEIAIVWKSRSSVIKCLFLMNRYLAPVPIAAHIWTFSGMASGLNDTNCRIIYSFASVAELVSISLVSLIMAIRLYAVHDLSNRALYVLITVWFCAFVAVSGLTVPNLWLRLNFMRYVPVFNICTFSVSSTVWTLLLPKVLEHGVLCMSLILNAMSTPRSSQTAMLAVLYKSGILYYAITFVILLVTMLTWRFASPIYIGMTAYTTGLLMALTASRLVLNMGSPWVTPLSENKDLPRYDIPLALYSRPTPSKEVVGYHLPSRTLYGVRPAQLVSQVESFASMSRSSYRASILISDDLTIRV